MYPTRKEITISAFVQKVYNFCKWMTEKGHTVYHYGHPDSNVKCTKHFDCITKETYDKDYGDQTWKEFHSQNVESNTHKEFNKLAGEAIQKNKKSKDELVLAFWGYGNKGACEMNDDLILVEASIGYDSYFLQNRCYETYNHLHRILGLANIITPNWADQVIPPGFDMNDFKFQEEKGDYLLYLGRMIDLKGINIANVVSKITKTPIKFVGPQNQENSMDDDNPLAEFIHTVSVEERKDLLANAKALIAPSLYMEPCGWVMLEAFASGTPVISTDWGGFAEYNLHGHTGLRCKNMNEFVHAVDFVKNLDPKKIRNYAEKNFSLDRQMNLYINYFKMLLDMREHGELGSIKKECNFTSPVIF